MPRLQVLLAFGLLALAAVHAVCPSATLTPQFITESNGKKLSISSTGWIQEDGVNLAGSSGSVAVVYINNIVYRKDATNNWYSWNGATWTNIGLTLPSCEPTPLFFDDFNTLSLYNTRNPSAGGTWRPASWYSPNDDGNAVNDGWMVNPFNPATPISQVYAVSGGNLVLNVTRTPTQYAAACGNKPFVTAQLVANSYSRLNGYFEARIKAPRIPGVSVAWWLMNSVSWPPEIDVVEIVAQSNLQLAAQTLWSMDQTNVQTIKYSDQGFDSTLWHTYGVDWQSATTTFYIDRVATLSRPTPSGYTNPMFPILSIQTGGSWSGSVAANAVLAPVLVDYVKVWATKPF